LKSSSDVPADVLEPFQDRFEERDRLLALRAELLEQRSEQLRSVLIAYVHPPTLRASAGSGDAPERAPFAAAQVDPGTWSVLSSEHYGRIVEPDHLQRSLDILRTMPPIDEFDGWLKDLEAESAAMPDHARQRLFDEWFAGAYEEIQTRGV
jgi:hypothetical protein